MSYLLVLAVKNLMRARRRTVLTFMVLSFGVAMYVLMASLMAGFDQASSQNIVNFETGHFKIRSSHFDEEHPLALENSDVDREQVQQQLGTHTPFVIGIAPRLHFLAELDNGRDVAPIEVVGIDPESDRKVFSLMDFVSEGSLEPGGMLIGRNLALDMKMKMGDQAYITFRDQQGMMTSIELRITGIMNTANPQVNQATIVMRLDQAQMYLHSRGVTEIALRTRELMCYQHYAPILRGLLPELRIEDWKQLSVDYMAMSLMKRKSQNVFLLLLLVIAMVGVVNTILMSVYEKRTEIGTLKALGFKDREVRNLFIWEGLLIGLLGGLLGLGLGALLNLYFAFHGLDLTAIMGRSDQNIGFQVMGIVKSVWDWPAYFRVFILAVAASVLASYYPAQKAIRMQPMECLRIVQ